MDRVYIKYNEIERITIGLGTKENTYPKDELKPNRMNSRSFPTLEIDPYKFEQGELGWTKEKTPLMKNLDPVGARIDCEDMNHKGAGDRTVVEEVDIKERQLIRWRIVLVWLLME